MSKVRHTKNELRKQKDALKTFSRYLPTLTLKKQQLQAEVIRVSRAKEKLKSDIKTFEKGLSKWVSVFAEDVGLKTRISAKRVVTTVGNIAGIDIPVFEGVEFEEDGYDYMRLPLWLDFGIEAVKAYVVLKARMRTLEEQLALISEELRITTQRVNLFEKVKIPEARENIRRISIFLGDLQTAAVVTGKIAKTKIERKRGALV